MATWQFQIYDRANGLVGDVTSISFNKTVSARLNRPASVSFEVPSDYALSGAFNVGLNTLKVRRNGVIQFNGLIWAFGDAGEANTTRTLVTAFDPMVWLGRRWVRDATGSTVDISFPSPTSGGSIVQQVVQNTIAFAGAVGLDATAGSFDLTGLDLSIVPTDFPTKIADYITLLTDTGAVDVYISPVDVGGVFAPDIMGKLNAVNAAGTDRPTVYYDYGTGSYSAAAVRRTVSMDEFCNDLRFYLGPKVSDRNPTRWKGSITGTAPHVGGIWPSSFTTAMTTSRTLYGKYEDDMIYSDLGTENATRPLFEKLYQTEGLLRFAPRTLLYVTPVRDPPFVPAIAGGDFSLGDTIRLNVSSVLRQAIVSASQKVYGWTVRIDDNGTEEVTELVTSADQ